MMNYVSLPPMVQSAIRLNRKIVKIEWFTNRRASNCEYSKVLVEDSRGEFENRINTWIREAYKGNWDFCRVFDITSNPELYDEECSGICRTIKYVKHSELIQSI